jgi:TRAP-type transport system small permease protein
MWLNKLAAAFYKVLRPVSGMLHKIAGGILAVMMLLTAADVLLRYIFNSPIMGSYDITEYLMGMLVALTIAYGATRKGLIKVELITDRLPPRTRAVLEIVSSLLGVGLLSLITWQSYIYTVIQANTHISSSVLHIPRYPFIGIVTFGLACLTLVLLADLIDNIARVVKK